MLASIDKMRVRHDQTFARLSENVRQTGGGKPLARNDIAKHIARADRRKLVRVADHDESRTGTHSAQQRLHQEKIDHRCLVDDDDILVKQAVFVPAKGDARLAGKSISSIRWMVFASMPVTSERRLAARPVGVASAMESPMLSKIRRIARTTVVLPVPGPPVRINTEFFTASVIAFFWSFSYRILFSSSDFSMRKFRFSTSERWSVFSSASIFAQMYFSASKASGR